MPDTIDDAYARLCATLPGIDSPRASQEGPSLRRYKAPAERRAERQMVDVRRRPVPEPADEPCGGCRHQARCTSEVICCESFALFTRVGNDYSTERWRWAPRQPSAAIMERLVGSARESKLERRREREAAAAELQRRDAEFEASGAAAQAPSDAEIVGVGL
jgi:hypothetical protein